MGKISMRGLDHARASARSTGMFLAALVIALCALTMGVNDAYAITVRDDGNGYKRAIVYPHDYPNGRYAALAEFLGYDWNSFSQQTKSAIINDNGKFMELYSSRCKNYRYENENLQDGSGSVIGAITTKLAEVVDSVSGSVFGNDKTWYCSCTDADYNAAKENIEEWLYPREGSTNQGGENISDWVYVCSATTLVPNPENKVLQLHKCRIDNNTLTVLNDTVNVDYNTVTIDFYVKGNAKTTYNNWTGDIFAYNQGIILVENGRLTENNSGVTVTGTSGNYRELYTSSDNEVYYDEQNNKIIYIASKRSSWNGARNVYSGYYYYGPKGGGGVTTPPYEPTPDPSPTAPIIQIGDVTIDLSNGPYTINNTTYTAVQDTDNNWTITITNNTTNNYSGDEQASDPTDYTSILNAILAAINSLRSEMTTYSNQINTALTNMSNNLQTAIKNADTSISNHIKALNQQMHSDIQTLQTNLQNSYNARMDAFAEDLWANIAALDGDLIDELDAVAKYIVEGIHFDSDFSDADIVKWLKMIYSRLKDKKVTVPSVDEDPKGWLDRLKEILDDLLDVILSGLNVATLATAFEGLKTRFPISIPWDIAAIVNMFAGGAVTPVFDLPLPNGLNGSYTTVHVDLHEWDDEMELMRQGELLLFGIVLMYNTKWMFDTVTMTFKRGE